LPANRSRTQRWHESLDQILERQGALELSFPASDPGSGDVIWRVRLLSVTDQEIAVEQPNAAGQALDFGPGLECIVGMSIGQNRWMFRTSVLPAMARPGSTTRPVRTMRLAMPDDVERCQRRNFYRISTAELSLPRVECWPLINPSSVVAAEVANRALIMDQINSGGSSRVDDDSLLLPEVGPRFNARLVNLGGGGAGLLIERGEASAADRARLFWMRVNLMPTIPAPIAMTARLVHTHIDSTQNLYAGMAFEWAFHAAHRDFVVAQITRYVTQLQKLRVAKAA